MKKKEALVYKTRKQKKVRGIRHGPLRTRKLGEWTVQLDKLAYTEPDMYQVVLSWRGRMVHRANYVDVWNARKRFQEAVLSAQRGYQTIVHTLSSSRVTYYHIPPEYERAVALLTAALGGTGDKAKIDGIGEVYYNPTTCRYAYWINKTYKLETN